LETGSVILHITEVCSWSQQVQKGIPDTPLPSSTLQLLLGHPGTSWDILGHPGARGDLTAVLELITNHNGSS